MPLGPADDAIVKRCPWQVLSGVAVCVEETLRWVGTSGLHGTECLNKTLGDLELVCNEAVPSRGREAWYPQLYI